VALTGADADHKGVGRLAGINGEVFALELVEAHTYSTGAAIHVYRQT
jgi:hypothetical protein